MVNQFKDTETIIFLDWVIDFFDEVVKKKL